jgi:hypothetical protein
MEACSIGLRIDLRCSHYDTGAMQILHSAFLDEWAKQ